MAATRRGRAAKISCGLLMYRLRDGVLSVLLAHPGGPYWRQRDLGAWSVPKGLAAPGEDLLAAARREFQEETGVSAAGPFHRLKPLRQRSGKTIHCWAFAGDADTTAMRSEPFKMEWPPRSGRLICVPETDRADFFTLDEAAIKIAEGQRPFLAELETLVRMSGAQT